MPKTIVILFDGTSNQIGAEGTNVVRLYRCLRKQKDQLIWYDPGVGTLGSPDSFFEKGARFFEVLGLATGWGLDRNVKEAYRFLVENYSAGTGKEEARDRIVICGFSRGAYTARVLAGFIRAVGLLDARNMNLLDYAYRAYKRIGEKKGEFTDDQGGAFGEVRLYEDIFRPDRPPIHCLALFDTVASVIAFDRWVPRLRGYAFTNNNPSVRSIRHAVALQERRTMFQPTLWPGGQTYHYNRFARADDAGEPQDLREVWFTGCHGDIGGGNAEAKSGLAKLPLRWMIQQLSAPGIGLAFTPGTVKKLVEGDDPAGEISKPDPKAPINESMTWAWAILEYLPRRVPRSGTKRPSFLGLYIPYFEKRTVPEGARIHQSVIDRGNLPENLPAKYEVEP